MAHQHEAPRNFNTAFAIGVALNVLFIVVEVIFGLRANSLALLADAGHNLSDVLGLLLAWGAMWLGAKRPSTHRTYGFRRSSILAALANAMLLLFAVGAIAWEAVHRFSSPMPVEGGTVVIVAGIGILINGATALLFRSGRKSDVNIEGAFLHMAADAAVSVGVVIGGVIIRQTGWIWIDPVVSLAIVAVITIGTWGLLRKSVNLAMDAVPEGIDPQTVREFLSSLAGVTQLHDLHIWGMSTTEVALTAHVIRPETGNDDVFLADVSKQLHERFGIEHATIQVERGSGEVCKLAPDDVV